MKDYIKRLIQKKEGFTLVELLIVIAIVAILAAIAIPQFTKYKNRAYDAELSSDAKNAYTAAVAYLTDSPNATIASQQMLNTGGYGTSANIVFSAGDMTSQTGNIKLVSIAAVDAKNAAVVLFNGRVIIRGAP